MERTWSLIFRLDIYIYIYRERERERELYSSVEIVHEKFTIDKGIYRSDCVVCVCFFYLIHTERTYKIEYGVSLFKTLFLATTKHLDIISLASVVFRYSQYTISPPKKSNFTSSKKDKLPITQYCGAFEWPFLLQSATVRFLVLLCHVCRCQ